MSEVKVEIRFNSKSSGQGVADALKIADNHEKSFDGKICIVNFASINDPDIEKSKSIIRTALLIKPKFRDDFQYLLKT